MRKERGKRTWGGGVGGAKGKSWLRRGEGGNQRWYRSKLIEFGRILYIIIKQRKGSEEGRKWKGRKRRGR